MPQKLLGNVRGKDGSSATVSFVEPVSLPSGSKPTLENLGSNTNAVLRFGIPAGSQGAPGSSVVGPRGEQGLPGTDGAPGRAATINVHGTTLVDNEADVKVANMGSENNASLHFYIQRPPEEITIDEELISDSTNPVQSKAIQEALDLKADSSSIPTKVSELTNDRNFVSESSINIMIEDAVEAAAIAANPVDDELSDTSVNAVQNKVVNSALAEKVEMEITDAIDNNNTRYGEIVTLRNKDREVSMVLTGDNIESVVLSQNFAERIPTIVSELPEEGSLDRLYLVPSGDNNYSMHIWMDVDGIEKWANVNSDNGNGETYTATTPISINDNVISFNDSGAVAGTYGPSDNVNGANGTTINVPQITINDKGIVTSIANRTYTSVDSTGSSDASSLSGIVPIANGGTGNDEGYIRTGSKAGAVQGLNSTSEGFDTVASGSYSHAEGNSTTASGHYSHAEGRFTTASEYFSHAEGRSTTASGNCSHAEGSSTTASGSYSHAEGNFTTASGDCSHAEGAFTNTNNVYCCHASGEFNILPPETANSDKSHFLIVGSGRSDSARSNCFRVGRTGVWSAGAYNSSGADYAEMFEWADGNTNNEDRVGKFVTLQGSKIRLANDKDAYILGVVSGMPSVVGDVFNDQWQGMYIFDVFGRPERETVTVPAETMEIDGESVTVMEEHEEVRQKLNPEYDHTKEYIPRSERQEWDPIGLVGKLVCIDDGTAVIDGYIKPNAQSIATYSEERTKYRVMERIDESHIRIVIL